MANLPDPNEPGGTTTRFFKTYTERFNDEALDPFSGDYGNVMRTFQASVGREAASRATTLYEQVFTTAEVQPHAYLHLTQASSGKAIITVLHRPHRHVGCMGSALTKQDICFLGDMKGIVPPTVVYFPEDAFRSTSNLTVPTSETLDQAFADDASKQHLGPYEEGDAGTQVVATRHMMYLPPKYVPIALSHPNMSPRTAWEQIGGLIRTGDGAVDRIVALQPLLTWLRAACTVGAANAHLLHTEPPSYPHPPIPALDEATGQRLKRDLPGLTTPTGPETGTTAAINHLTDEFLRANQAREHRDRTSTTKTPESYYGQGVVLLCRLTYAPTPDLLPEVYHDIAKSPKRMERQAIEERFRAVADTLSLLEYVPPATSSLTKKISSCDYSHFNLNDLEAGLHPFCTTYKSPEARTQLQQSLAVYDDLRDSTGASIADFQVLKEAEKVGMPYSITEVTYCFKSFRIPLHTLLGSIHPISAAWDQFVSLWTSRETRLAEHLRPHQMPLVVRWCQLRFSHWFTDQTREPGCIPVPQFSTLITKILLEEQWEPVLPAKYRVFPNQMGGGGLPRAPPARAPAPAQAPPQGRGERVPGRGERVNNSTFVPRFQEFRDLGLPLATVRSKATEANKPVPTNASGTEFCLSYHVLGFCWANCGRIEDHRVHAAAEETTLFNWCRECYKEGGPL